MDEGEPLVILPDLSITRMASIGAGVETPVMDRLTSNWLQTFCCTTVLFMVICPIALFVIKRTKQNKRNKKERQIEVGVSIFSFIAYYI